MPLHEEATELATAVREKTTALQDARGALAQRPLVVINAKSRVAHRDRLSRHDMLSQAAHAAGATMDTGSAEEANAELAAANASMKESAESFSDARDDAEATLGDAMMMAEELESAQGQLQERVAEATMARIELFNRFRAASDRADAGEGGGLEESQYEVIQRAEVERDEVEEQFDRARQIELDLQNEARLNERALPELGEAGAALEDELTIAKSPTFEGWNVEGLDEQEEISTALDQVEADRRRRTQADQRRGQDRADNRKNTKTILGGTLGGGVAGSLLGGGLGAVVGGIAGTFLGSTAIGAGVGAAAGALLGGVAGAGFGALFGAVSGRGDRRREAAARQGPSAPQTTNPRPRLQFDSFPSSPEASLAPQSRYLTMDDVSASSSPEASLVPAGAGVESASTRYAARQGAPHTVQATIEHDEGAAVPATRDGVDDMLDRLDEDRDR